MSKLLTQIDLLRHGDTEFSNRYCGSTNHPLTSLGWQQLWKAVKTQGAKLHPWQYIVTSPLQRCTAFATELGQCHHIPVIEDMRFQEIHFGGWENHSSADIMQSNPTALTRFWQNPLIFTPPNAESLIDFSVRVLTAWEALIYQHQGEKVLLITHGGVIRVILCHLHDQSLESLFNFTVDHADLYSIKIPATSNNVTITYHGCNV